MIPPLSRPQAIATLTLLLLSTLPLQVSAHAHLSAATPAADAALDESPEAIDLAFSEAIEPALSRVTLQRVDGDTLHEIETGALDAGGEGNTDITLPLKAPLEAGEYEVHWDVLADDGHRTQGHYSFVVQ